MPRNTKKSVAAVHENAESGFVPNNAADLTGPHRVDPPEPAELVTTTITVPDEPATDPVALDRLGWQVIDSKRQQMGLLPVGESKWQGVSFRQPEHIFLADALGLGESDLAKIEHVRITLGA